MTRPRRTRRPASPNQVPRTARLGQVLREIVGRGARAHRRRAPRARARHRRRRRRRPEPGHRLLRLAHRRGRRRLTSWRPSPRCGCGCRPPSAVSSTPARRRSWSSGPTTCCAAPSASTASSATSIGSRTIARRKPPTVHGLAVVDKPAGMDQPRRGGQGPGASWASSGSATPAPSIPTPPACSCSASARSTRLLRFLSEAGKRYAGEVVLGTATDTLDAAGAGDRHLRHVHRDARRRCGRPVDEHLTGRHRAGAADGVGAEGRRPSPPRAGPGGHRGGAGGAARHGALAST